MTSSWSASCRCGALRVQLASPAVLQLAHPLDLRDATHATLRVWSWRTLDAPIAEVQVSADGGEWRTLAQVPATDGWDALEVDLSANAGAKVAVRFVLSGDSVSESGAWWLSDREIPQGR